MDMYVHIWTYMWTYGHVDQEPDPESSHKSQVSPPKPEAVRVDSQSNICLLVLFQRKLVLFDY